MKGGIVYMRLMSVVATLSQIAIQTGGATVEHYPRSKIESGVYFLLCPVRGTYTATTSDAVAYVLQSTNETPKTVGLPAHQKFKFRVELFSTNGTAIPKTKLGRQFGAEFDKMPADPSKVKVQWERTIGSHELGRAKDLFEIRDKGEYTLKFQLQLFVADRGFAYRLVRFPAVEYRLIHE
jgi:hypothetical protein